MKAVFRYPGSKWGLARWIIDHFPSGYEKLVYLEPFAGSSAVFFNKTPGTVETINDLDSDVVNLFRILRDRPDDFKAALRLTPYSREEYDLAFAPCDDPLEKARRYMVKCNQAIGAKMDGKCGWRNHKHILTLSGGCLRAVAFDIPAPRGQTREYAHPGGSDGHTDQKCGGTSMRIWNRFYRDEGDHGGTPLQTPPSQPANAPAAAPASAKPEEIATAFLAALEKRTQRVETGVAKSFAEQYGMSESELATILDKAKAEKASKLPEAALKQITEATEKANARLIAAEIKLQGATMGLIDPDVASQLIDRKGIKVGDDGTVTGVKEALEALKQQKAYLYGANPAPHTGGFNPTGGGTQEDAFDAKLRAAMGLKPDAK